MTASDLHQRMLHLLDRAKAMSAEPPHAQHEPVTPPAPQAATAEPAHPASEDSHVPDVMSDFYDMVMENSTSTDPGNARAEPRQKVLRKGKITYSNGNFEVECQIRDLNSAGAKLRLSGDVTVPSCFELIIYPEKICKTAQVCWRDELTLGIRFIED